MLPFFVAFTAMFVLDFVWVGYTRAVNASNANAAGVYAGAVALLSGLGVVVYASNPWAVAAGVLGGYCGTFVAVRTHDSKSLAEFVARLLGVVK